jgi:phenylpropionate dioxygenase-like ring-hydroxylating dioxygenase large terminal subunit
MNMIANDFTLSLENRRAGLPAWTYTDRELFEVEKEHLFRRHWQLACHVSDVAEPGAWLAFDIAGERAVIVRGKDGTIRGFHNVCRHRGSRVVAGERGRCKSAMVCPFHGWSYNLDGTLRAVPQAKTLPKLDPREDGLTPVECEVWQGFVFVRFKPGPQPSLSTLMAPYEAEFAGYGLDDWVAVGPVLQDRLEVNWKAVRDVDNEGYHVPIAHPALHELYGQDYRDERVGEMVFRSRGVIGGAGASLWSVKNYLKLAPQRAELPHENRDKWVYFGLFPNLVIMLYPELVGFYQEIPLAVDRTIQRFSYYRPKIESREGRAARYLAWRIDRMTGAEDAQLIKWSWEATQSSGYRGAILSDLERGVRDWHDLLRAAIPATMNESPPAR